jgi:hypothetical protein
LCVRWRVVICLCHVCIVDVFVDDIDDDIDDAIDDAIDDTIDELIDERGNLEVRK